MENRMHFDNILERVRDCFDSKLVIHGTTPEGVYWNSVEAQEIRFAQLLKVINSVGRFSLLDYGCGYGALAGYLRQGQYDVHYAGFDISAAMIDQALETNGAMENCRFTSDEHLLESADYVVESGIFNLKLDSALDAWTGHVLGTLDRMNSLAVKGMAFNMLTKYSDADRMRSDLFYADPCFFFDYCKRNYSRNVVLLHDYELYDFTILVRK
jgi:SAM-dependent methyltransferase